MLEVVAPCRGVGCGGHVSCQMGSSIAGGQSRQRCALPVLSPLLRFVVKGIPATQAQGPPPRALRDVLGFSNARSPQRRVPAETLAGEQRLHPFALNQSINQSPAGCGGEEPGVAAEIPCPPRAEAHEPALAGARKHSAASWL